MALYGQNGGISGARRLFRGRGGAGARPRARGPRAVFRARVVKLNAPPIARQGQQRHASHGPWLVRDSVSHFFTTAAAPANEPANVSAVDVKPPSPRASCRRAGGGGVSVESTAGGSTAHALSAVYVLCKEGLNSGRTRQCAPGTVCVCVRLCAVVKSPTVYIIRGHLGRRGLGQRGLGQRVPGQWASSTRTHTHTRIGTRNDTRFTRGGGMRGARCYTTPCLSTTTPPTAVNAPLHVRSTTQHSLRYLSTRAEHSGLSVGAPLGRYGRVTRPAVQHGQSQGNAKVRSNALCAVRVAATVHLGLPEMRGDSTGPRRRESYKNAAVHSGVPSQQTIVVSVSRVVC